jgi:hypothetical protein
LLSARATSSALPCCWISIGPVEAAASEYADALALLADYQPVAIVLDFTCYGTHRKVLGAKTYRRTSNGDQVRRLSALAINHKPSVDFAGYWQRDVWET